MSKVVEKIVRGAAFLWVVISALISTILIVSPAAAQTVTIVGTQHLRGLETRPTSEQYAHTIDALSKFGPTQVCIERMDGERLQALSQDPMRNSWSLSPEIHSRPTGTRYIPLGMEMQTRLAVRPADARDEARDLALRWDEIELSDKIRLIALQTAGYEIYSSVLNWSYLDDDQRAFAKEGLLAPLADTLDELLDSSQEAFALGLPIARRAGLHRLCMADALENETAGMQAAFAYGAQQILDDPAIKAGLEAYDERMKSAWKPDSGPDALTKMLAFMNSEEFTEFDRENQWELLRRFDNEAGAFHRRLMHWNARTAQISAELFEALAESPNERVMLIIGSAHRPFNEAELRSHPWIAVEPASKLLRPTLKE